VLGLLKRLFSVGVSIGYVAVRDTMRAAARLVNPEQPPAPPVVLTYHALQERDVTRFEAQMRHLRRRATPVFADDERPLNGRPVVAVTFDDAFQSVYEHALPVLARQRIPATIFVPTGYMGTSPRWIPVAARNGGRGRVMSPETLAALDARWVRVGSHTVTHPHLAELPPHTIHSELAASKSYLERLQGAPVRMLSLPYGSCSSSVLEEAKTAGYNRVFANVPVIESRRDEAFVLIGRINVTPEDWPLEFELKARGAYDWLSVAIPAKRALTSLMRHTRS
jgi:peptidoglycan/xylan/chitin deacetylase (PgdA/CDA1 family)